ncbi:unnamed protein product, partial [Gongylonema pulchrum]|uniref:SET domain-containing protein n=1 Tax=Gongylonema pulchrum TaxID=637853 RepID=A0A183ETI2_9BILA
MRLARIREKEYAEDDNIGSFMYFFKFKNKQYCVDATDETSDKGRLINHSVLRPNLKTKVVELKGTKHLILVAKRDIEVGEELLYDYGDRTPCSVAENPW